MILLPPHCTHRMQREDLAMFQSFKNVFRRQHDIRLVEKFRQCEGGRPRPLSFTEDWVKIAKPAWDAASAQQNNLRGWRLSGVNPFTELPLWHARELAVRRGRALDAAFAPDSNSSEVCTIRMACFDYPLGIFKLAYLLHIIPLPVLHQDLFLTSQIPAVDTTPSKEDVSTAMKQTVQRMLFYGAESRRETDDRLTLGHQPQETRDDAEDATSDMSHDEDDAGAAAAESDNEAVAGSEIAAVEGASSSSAGVVSLHKRKKDWWKEGPMTRDEVLAALHAEEERKRAKVEQRVKNRESKIKRDTDARDAARKLAKLVFKNVLSTGTPRSSVQTLTVPQLKAIVSEGHGTEATKILASYKGSEKVRLVAHCSSVEFQSYIDQRIIEEAQAT